MEPTHLLNWRRHCLRLASAAAGGALFSCGLIAYLGGEPGAMLAGAVAAAGASAAGTHGVPGQVAFEPRCAHPVVRRSTTENSSYIPIAIAPTATSPAKASPICIDEPAEMSR